MDPNFEGPKIPLLTLAGITNLTDVLQELPLPGPHPDAFGCSLFAFLTHPIASHRRLAHSNDPNNVSNIVKALSSTSVDEIVLKDSLQDKNSLAGLNVPPLLQAILAQQPDIFASKKILPTTIGSNIKHNSPVQAATPQSPAISYQGLPIHQASPAECASQTSFSLTQNDSRQQNRIFNPPPNGRGNDFMVDNSFRKSPEENPKICLKIRRKKKQTKEKEMENSVSSSNDLECLSSVEYGIVRGPEKQLPLSSPGPLKLKLSRVKTELVSNLQQTVTNTDPMFQHNMPSQNTGQVGNMRQTSLHVPHGQPAFYRNDVSSSVHSSKVKPPPYPQDFNANMESTPVLIDRHHALSTMHSENNSFSYRSPPLNHDFATTPSQQLTKSKSKHSRSSESNRTSGKSKKKNCQRVRVKFIADQEEADIYKLSDVLYPDDTEVSSFGELKSGMMVVAKWPQNGKMYEALVIDHLENTGRKFRERKAPPKPFQVGGDNRDKVDLSISPHVVLEPLDLDYANSKTFSGNFNAYHSLADRIKLKRKKKLSDTGSYKKKRLSDSAEVINQSLITIDSDEELTPSKVSHSMSSKKKRERRRLAELRMTQDGGSAQNSIRRFTTVTEVIFEDIDCMDATAVSSSLEDPVSEEMLVPSSRLREVMSEAAKLKAMGILNQIPIKLLIKLLSILEPNIRASVRLNPLNIKGDFTSQELKWKQEAALEQVHASSNSALAALYIMTSPGMPKAVFIEDVMERAIQLVRFQLENTIYPEYDTVYRVHNKKSTKGGNKDMTLASSKQKRAHYKGTKSKPVSHLYNKMVSLMGLMVELLEMQPLTDTSILQVSSIAVSPFFVENVRELQLSAIRLTTTAFSRYERHRKIIMEDIFQSLARLPTSKRNLRNFRLNYCDEDYSDDEDTSQVVPRIQMVSALVLQMVQAIVHLPIADKEEERGNSELQIDELRVVQSYDGAWRTGQSFLAVFLKKCASKSEEIDYRPIFENFVHDLLATVNKPEWPGSEMMLSILGRLLVHTFTNRHTEVSLRVASIDYLGIVAAKLRRDSVSSHLDINVIKSLLEQLDKASKNEEEENIDNTKVEQMEEEKNKPNEDTEDKIDSGESGKAVEDGGLSEERMDSNLESRLQKILLDYIRSNANADPALMFAHNFYIGQWFRDISRESSELHTAASKNKENVLDGSLEAMDKQSLVLQKCEMKKKSLLELANIFIRNENKWNSVGNNDAMTPNKRTMKTVASQLSYDNAALITRYLASSRPFSHAFDTYLTHILHVREESAVAVRTRALKCLAEIVAVDPSILSRNDIWQGVQSSMVDASTSVREAAVDLVGRFILLKPELVSKYYSMLTARILDTGVSVRKRVIKILRDLCHEHPDLPQLTDACVKMIRRINDEEGIKKLVHEVFMRMWFTPLQNKSATTMRLKALSIADVVAANKDVGYEWIEQMMFDLINTEKVDKSVETACRQIVDCLINHLIRIEHEQKDDADNDVANSDENEQTTDTADANFSGSKPDDQSQGTNAVANALKGRKPQAMIAATMRTLVLFAKMRPKLLVPHVMTLQPHLSTKCVGADELQTLQSVCSLLELAVPHLQHPGEAFLASLEEDLMKLIIREKFLVVKSAITCLGSVTIHITQNYKLVWECFQKLGALLHGMRSLHQKSGFSPAFNSKVTQLLRTLFIIGHLMKTFDFDTERMKGAMQICIKDKVYDCVHYFTQLDENEELQRYAVGSLGLLMIKDPNMMFREETKACYNWLLDPKQKSDILKNQVLLNLQTYLSDEDVRMQEAAKASSHKSKEDPMTMGLHARKQFELQKQEQEESEDIKEICEISSGMASSVMQVYLKQVLECFFHPHLHIRHAALNTVYLTLNQGLVHPQQCVPFIIAMSSDGDQTIYGKSEQLLSEVIKRYSGFVYTKALAGIKMAFELHKSISTQVARGWRASRNSEDASTKKACLSHLYMLMRSDRRQRRAFMTSLLKLFDDTVKSDLGLLLFIADNLAYFPYLTQDEPLYLISQIDVYVSVSGSNVLQSFRECLVNPGKWRKKNKNSEDPQIEANDPDMPKKNIDSSNPPGSDPESDFSDGEQEEGLIARLPHNDAPLSEFVETSMACLLLLWVKQHLKTMFGFTEKKISRYLPKEPVKAHDKQVVKKRPDLLFEATRVCDYLLKKLKGTLPLHVSQNEEFRKLIVDQHNEFVKLMNKLDPNEVDSDSDKETTTKKTEKKDSTLAPVNTDTDGLTVQENPPLAVEEVSDRDSDDNNRNESALDVIRKSGISKHKKKLMKQNRERMRTSEREFTSVPKELRSRSKAVKYAESSGSDSEEEFLGF